LMGVYTLTRHGSGKKGGHNRFICKGVIDFVAVKRVAAQGFFGVFKGGIGGLLEGAGECSCHAFNLARALKQQSEVNKSSMLTSDCCLLFYSSVIFVGVIALAGFFAIFALSIFQRFCVDVLCVFRLRTANHG
jgi:hypothetical protein